MRVFASTDNAFECDSLFDGCISFPRIDAIVMAQSDSRKWYVGHRMMRIIDDGGQIVGLVANRYDAGHGNHAECTQHNYNEPNESKKTIDNNICFVLMFVELN